jgi:flavin-dependent dehydrogenase
VTVSRPSLAASSASTARSFEYDIAIVGGGPAGTSTALHLARAEGIAPERVLLLDKATHPREKPCAGAVSGWGLDALAKIGVPLDVPHVTMRGLRVLDGPERGASQWSARGGDERADARSRRGAGESGLGVVVRRNEFDASLWRRAAGDGIRAYDNEALIGLTRVAGGWEIATMTRTIRAHLLAACDGAGSTVRKRLQLGEAARKGHLYVLETEPREIDDGPRGGLCDFDMTPCAWGAEGYYWDFPTVIGGLAHVSRGIYHANLSPRSDVKAMLGRALAARGIDLASVKLKPFSTRPFVEGSVLALDRLALVGEAAGIDATTGEGIAQAILFGAIAAHHLAQAIRLDSGRLEGYARDVRRARVGRHLLQSAWLARVVYGPRGGAWRRYLARSERARGAGMRWYAGERLSWSEKGELAAGLAREIVARRRR